MTVTVLRQLLCLATAAAVSWWFILRPVETEIQPVITPSELLAVALLPPPPEARERPTVPAPTTAEASEASAPAEPAPSEEPDGTPPPPSELGVVDGEGEEATEVDTTEDPPAEPEASASAAEPEETQPDEPVDDGADAKAASESADDAATGEKMMREPELLAVARDELSGKARKGFATTFIARPQDQLDIARYFGEELVVIPRWALDPSNPSPSWFRLSTEGPPKVQTMESRPPKNYRQYRDLFAYDYASLPKSVRDLRKRVPARGQIHAFAALIPPSEWALVVGRRREALTHWGRDESDVSRFVLAYVRNPSRGFDIEVREIVFADGSRVGGSVTTGG